jgi:tripartite-type tricarboxylate transporter receptor subunit TctC
MEERTVVLRRQFCGAAALAGATLARPALGQAWPERPVRMIVPFPPAGAADIVGRMLAAHFQQAFGRPFIIENRPGAGSSIGVDALAKSAPDGYAIGLINIASNAILPAVRRQPLAYEPRRDFAPIANLAVTPCLLLVNPRKLPQVTSVAALVAHAKAHPEKLDFASSGVGSSLHLGMELFMQKADIRMTHVPFTGGGPALQGLLSGTVDLSIDVAATTGQLIREGRLRALATTMPARMASYPELPTLAETYPGTELAPWHGLAAPAGTPTPVLERLAAETRAFLALPETQERYRQQSLDAAPQTEPAAFAAFMREELDRFRDLAQAARITVD